MRGNDFGYAVGMLKAGKRVSREGWNGKGMWLQLIIPQNGPMPVGIDKYLPYIMMKTADNCLVPWLASQTDILAEDWMVVG